MGLDISYYERVSPTDSPTDDEIENGEVLHWYTVEGYEARLDDIDAKYVIPSGKSGGFRAGSYGGYNRFRELLSLVIGGVAEMKKIIDMLVEPKPLSVLVVAAALSFPVMAMIGGLGVGLWIASVSGMLMGRYMFGRER